MTAEGDFYAEYDDDVKNDDAHSSERSAIQQSHAHNQAHAYAPSSSFSSSQQPLHLEFQQQRKQQPPNPNMEGGNDTNNKLQSSLIYNRTIQAHNTNYLARGSHSVGGHPLFHHHHHAATNNNNIGPLFVDGGPDGGGAAAVSSIPGNAALGGSSTGRGILGYALPSSVQMQLQMQQMSTAATLQQQQLSASLSLSNGLLQSHTSHHHHQKQQQQQHMQQQQQQHMQQQNQEYRMMPPPPSQFSPASMGGNENPSQPLYHLNNNGDNYFKSALANSSMTTGSGAVFTTNMNATSSADLMEALNAQIAANHAAINNITNAVALSANAMAASDSAGNGFLHNYMLPQHIQSNFMSVGMGNLRNNWSAQQFDCAQLLSGDSSTLSNVSSTNNYNTPLVAPPPPVGEGYINYNTDNTVFPPVVDFRNGKKRTSPSVPLHPSKLQSLHNCGGFGVNNTCNSAGSIANGNTGTGMNSVAEEGEESASIGVDNVQVMNNTVVTPQKLLQQYQQVMIHPSHLVDHSNASGSGSINQGVVSQQGPIDFAHDQCSSNEPAFSEDPHPQQNLNDKTENASKANISTSSSFGDPPAWDYVPNEIRQGEVLTNPSIPASNSGLDNSDGNLIVRRGDIFRIPKTNIHCHPPSVSGSPMKNRIVSDDGFVEYKVVSLLGQGTFAQVFHCVDQQSNDAVAVKIVKNKPAYTRQAAVEIDVFRKLNASSVEEKRSENEEDVGPISPASTTPEEGTAAPQDQMSSVDDGLSPFSSTKIPSCDKSIIRLMCYFMHCSHLCLVFEMLGPNLYEILKKRQFRGLPIEAVRTLVEQAAEGIQLLGKTNVVHCDLKPENILMIRDDVESVITECKREGNLTQSNPDKPKSKEGSIQWIKLIDFGSACFEGQTAHSYIQSRFYRSPEVLIGLPYDSSIDIWSLGCVAAELFLGLPILPGVHEHDQLGRILEMVGPLPDWMVEQGSKSGKFFKISPSNNSQPEWVFRTRQEYINILTEEEKRSKGGLAKLEQQQTNRYFKMKSLEDIVMHHGICNTKKEREQLGLFVHFLKGMLHPDPWKRWTAHQVLNHPFLSGKSIYRIKADSTGCDDTNGTQRGVKPYDILWVPPWDASISRRKLLAIQKAKEKEALQAQETNSNRVPRRMSVAELRGGIRTPISQSVPETRAMGPRAHFLQPYLNRVQVFDPPLGIKTMFPPYLAERASSNMSDKSSPLQAYAHGGQSLYTHPVALSSSLGGVRMPLAFQRLADLSGIAGHTRTNVAGRSYSENMYPAHMSPQQQRPQASLSELYDAPMLQPPPPLPPIMGAQSFSGIYYQGMHPHVESELGYALQRPGVVPGIGSDGFVSLRGQTSQLNLESQMLSPCLSALSSPTPRNNQLPPPGLNKSYQVVAMSPGGLLLSSLGLQDHLFVNQSNTAGAGVSLLSRQLEEYSHPDQQQGHYVPSRHNRFTMSGSLQATSISTLNHRSVLGDNTTTTIPNLQHCFPLDSELSHHDALAAAPMSLSSIAYTQPHSRSFSDFGSKVLPSASFPLVLQNNSCDPTVLTMNDFDQTLDKHPSMG